MVDNEKITKRKKPSKRNMLRVQVHEIILPPHSAFCFQSLNKTKPIRENHEKLYFRIVIKYNSNLFIH